jgi:hypothetical protein
LIGVRAVRGERQRRRTERLPRRRTDRLADAVAWLLTTLGLLTTVLALLTGARLYDEGMHRVGVDTAERTQVEAALLEPAGGSSVARLGRAARPLSAFVPARYTSPDGVEHVADVQVRGPRVAGARVPIWVDRSGTVTTPPTRRIDAIRGAAAGAVWVMVAAAVALGAAWAVVRAAVGRANAAHWEREWTQVEPRWSGRPRP